MNKFELEELLNESQPIKVSFDGYEFIFEFENGTTVNVTHMPDHGGSCWDISSKSFEERIKELRLRERRIN